MLIGSRGLLPVATFLDTLAQRSFGFFDAPTLFWWARSDTSITVGVVVGLLLSLFALVASLKHRLASKVGWLVRPALGLMAFLYLSYATAGRVFFGFQWDNLLVECTVIAALTPRRARSTWAIWAIRLLLFKLYFESGIAKAQSYLHDWQDGSAMTFYYETAPIPTRLA
ncbi:MAG: lipase maturation factor family protein [Polyangiaceae bacterium]